MKNDVREHGETTATGILLANLGTPDAPTTPALRKYLRQFLSDPRVIQLPKWKWQIILNLFVLPTRPAKSAEAYREVWTDEGSPLLIITREQAAKLETALRERFDGPLHVAVGMRYGNPSMDAALKELEEKGCRRILLFPAYPQYSATTTASTFDEMAECFKTRGWLPEFRMVRDYYDHPLYIEALKHTVEEVWAEGGKPDKLLMSFHGIPTRYFVEGRDPYHCLCQKTGRLLAESLGLNEDEYLVSFQSLFGREEWLKPYTDATLKGWAKDGVEKVDVICPGFSADCLETIEEIDQENREYFEEGGGKQYRYIAALNARDDHVACLTEVALHHLQGWGGTRVSTKPTEQQVANWKY
ncbi:MAG: ferrochelatase [Planctomycetota bacterium]